MNSINILKDLFRFHGNNVFIKSSNQSITFWEFFENLKSIESSSLVIEEPDPIVFLFKLFSLLLSDKTPILIHPYWPNEPKLAARQTASQFFCNTPSIGVFTSGSSGKPKLALLPISSFLNSARSANENINFDSGDQWILSLPLFHVGGLGIIFRSLVSGGTVRIADSPFEHLLMHDMSITHVSMVPTQLYRFLKNTSQRNNLKTILLGGAAISEKLILEAYQRELPIIRSYGMTETASQIFATQPGASLSDLHTSGRALTGNSLRLEPETNRILIKSHSAMLGYWSNQKLDLHQNDNGELITNDVGRFRNGNLIVEGRLDRAFKCGGEMLQPESIELILLNHPDIVEAHVLPEPDDEYGHIPVAYIKTNQNEISQNTQQHIEQFLKEHVKGLFYPKKILDMNQHFGRLNLKSHL